MKTAKIQLTFSGYYAYMFKITAFLVTLFRYTSNKLTKANVQSKLNRHGRKTGYYCSFT